MKNEKGVVLVLCLLTITILTTLAITFLSVALLEHQIANE